MSCLFNVTVIVCILFFYLSFELFFSYFTIEVLFTVCCVRATTIYYNAFCIEILKSSLRNKG